MKFYISAAKEAKVHVKRINNILKENKHEVIERWWELTLLSQYKTDPDFAKENARTCLKAVMQSDAMIHLSDYCGREACIELGAIIGYTMTLGPKPIYVIGKKVNESSFYFSDSVRRILTNGKTIDEIITQTVIPMAVSEFDKIKSDLKRTNDLEHFKEYILLIK